MTWSTVSIGAGRLERRPAGDQRIQRRPQRVDVGRRTHLAALAPGLLGRHVAGRPHDLARAGQPAVALDLLGQPEVGDPGIAVPIEQDVPRLEVAVDHAAPVGILDRLGDRRPSAPAASRGGSGPSASRWARLSPSTKPMREIMLALVLADLEDRHDARMVEVGRRLGLDVEAADVGLVGELAGEDHLQRHRPVEAHLPGLEDDAHAAAGQLADDLVIAEVADAG